MSKGIVKEKLFEFSTKQHSNNSEFILKKLSLNELLELLPIDLF
jgi:hypothetical protein